MVDEKCSNCMLQRRGDCFGEEKICESYKPIPHVEETEVNNWPALMRSNRHSNHVEWKREQEKILNESRLVNKNSKARRIARNNSVSDEKEWKYSEVHLLKLRENVNKVGIKYKDTIIIWICVYSTKNGKFICRYLLEYNKHFRGGKTGEQREVNSAICQGVNEAIERVIEAHKYDIVIVFSSWIIKMAKEDSARFIDLFYKIKKKAKECFLFASTTKDSDISLYIKKHILNT